MVVSILGSSAVGRAGAPAVVGDQGRDALRARAARRSRGITELTRVEAGARVGRLAGARGGLRLSERARERGRRRRTRGGVADGAVLSALGVAAREALVSGASIERSAADRGALRAGDRRQMSRRRTAGALAHA